MTSVLPRATYELFDARNFAHLVTLLPDGSPYVSPKWVERDGKRAVVLNTGKPYANRRPADVRVIIRGVPEAVLGSVS